MKSLRKIFHSSSNPSMTSNELSKTHPSANPSKLTPVTVIELFQSQGCNSCPPANDLCISLSDRKDPFQLFLTYEVTYWDHLGWPDTFGDARWDARQTAYATALRQRSCYTPQVIVDGGARPIGGSWRNLPAVLEKVKSTKNRDGLRFEIKEGQKLKIEGETIGTGLVFVVFYEVEPKPVRILRGENKEETLPHRNVVRDMAMVGKWEGIELEVQLPARRSGLEMALLVQADNGGQVLGAVRT